MAKVLLGLHNIEKYIDRETQSMYMDGTFIIPPGVKDYLQTEGISLVYAKPEKPVDKEQALSVEVPKSVAEQNDSSQEMITALTRRIAVLLKDEHQVTDEETITRICLLVIKQINN